MAATIDRDWLTLLAFCGLYATWIFLPLVPAVLIYWLFPDSKVAVSGPFAGLTVKAGGAFAAYLIIFAAVYFALVPTTRDYIVRMQREFWIVKGNIELHRADGSAYPHSEALLNKLRLVTPNTYKFNGSSATVKIEEDDEGALPLVIIEIPSFGQQIIPLSSMPPSKLSIDYSRKIIRIKEPIIIEESGSDAHPGQATLSLAGAEPKATDSSDKSRP
jgi:hypothetical protein